MQVALPPHPSMQPAGQPHKHHTKQPSWPSLLPQLTCCSYGLGDAVSQWRVDSLKTEVVRGVDSITWFKASLAVQGMAVLCRGFLEAVLGCPSRPWEAGCPAGHQAAGCFWPSPFNLACRCHCRPIPACPPTLTTPWGSPTATPPACGAARPAPPAPQRPTTSQQWWSRFASPASGASSCSTMFCRWVGWCGVGSAAS
jgi:hypothetical protein